MSKIEAKIIKHSKCPKGHELVTYELVYPRIIHSELLTHRMFSKNASSSRAVPSGKMIDTVESHMFCPDNIQKAHKGMQGSDYFLGDELEECRQLWIESATLAIKQARKMHDKGISKQIINRILEPYQYYKIVLTTGLEGLRNFFELRNPEYVLGLTPYKSKKECVNTQRTLQEPSPECLGFTELDWLKLNKGQAEIHMMELAEQMYDAYNESMPQLLNEGEWHIPYEEFIDLSELAKLLSSNLKIPSDYYDVECEKDLDSDSFYKIWLEPYVIKASTGMLARASYITVGDDKVPSIETLIGIHDKMVNARPKHSSPMEHCSRVLTEEKYYLFSKGMDGQKDHEHGWCMNYRGFMNYRYILEQAHQA